MYTTKHIIGAFLISYHVFCKLVKFGYKKRKVKNLYMMPVFLSTDKEIIVKAVHCANDLIQKKNRAKKRRAKRQVQDPELKERLKQNI